MTDQVPVSASKGTPVSRSGDRPMDWLRGEIDRLFEDFGRPASSIFSFGNRSPTAPVPAVEMVDDGKAYRLTVELPGLSEEDIAVNITEGVLDISGEKKEETERKDKGYLYSERRYGSFHRQISGLPAMTGPVA
ncbi:Hsp20/alpha crystallin family protein [Sphingopyxis sp. DBS4]|uniref:Hsp20/alpha crystallin family protein n=1 Tax=Sphingopyxis sp. DBS4 TaxID=2968500 RepID=UPI00214B9021|nr:Hsp20/alpha crystallin family protein [Sphingopyxis sp. DBS4]